MVYLGLRLVVGWGARLAVVLLVVRVLGLLGERTLLGVLLVVLLVLLLRVLWLMLVLLRRWWPGLV